MKSRVSLMIALVYRPRYAETPQVIDARPCTMTSKASCGPMAQQLSINRFGVFDRLLWQVIEMQAQGRAASMHGLSDAQ